MDFLKKKSVAKIELHDTIKHTYNLSSKKQITKKKPNNEVVLRLTATLYE